MKKFICIIFILAIFVIAYFMLQPVNNEQTSTSQQEIIIQEDVLSQIDNYQTEYWTIIKKHNMFIQIGEFDNDIEKDKTDLNNLYKKVESKINKNNQFLKELNNINGKYGELLKNAQTQTEMNILSGEYLEKTDDILNKVYQEIRKHVSQSDFEKLKTSEIKWINDMEDYQNYIIKQDFGSIIGLLYGKTLQDIKNFRALLLIFYLESETPDSRGYFKSNIQK